MTPPDPAARIGQVIDRYQLEDVLGSGGFGTVYRARHTVMNRVVALKLLHGRPDENQQKRFVREAQATAALRHPSIVQVFDFGTTPAGEMFLVMELLEGEELEGRRMRSPLPPHEVIQIMCEVLEALTIAHAAGVVHRDLKPANIFLTPQGVKLLDFGISLVREDEGAERMTQAGLVMGTPLYMAPESFTGVRDVDERVDIYAVAAMLYELLSGRTVFSADTYEELVVKVATQPATPMAQVAPGAPPGLAAVIDRGLASKPSARWQTAAAFRDALMPYVRDAEPAVPLAQGVSAVTSAPTSAEGPRAVRPLQVGAAALALLGVCLGGAAILMNDAPPDASVENAGAPTQNPEAPQLGSPGVALGAGTCEAPQVLALGQPFVGNTRGGPSVLTPSCGGGSAAERVHVLQLSERMQVSARVDADFDSVLSLTSGCGAALRELACNDDFDGVNRSQVSELLEPGTYYLVVDGYDGESGPYTLVANGVAPLQAGQCGNGAPTLTPGVDVRGSSAGRPNDFEATCVTPSGPDFVYRLEVGEPSRLRIRQTADEDGALHVRSECARLESEIACNDDHGDSSRSLVRAQVEAGTYWVVSDGYDSTDGGAFTLRAEVFAESSVATAPDSCAAPHPLTTAPVRTDTFRAADQLQGSCGGRGAPEQVFVFALEAPARVRVDVLESEHPGAYYIRQRCQDSTSEMLCGVFADGVGVEETQGEAPAFHDLTPGNYFLIVDGVARGFGAAHIQLIRSPL